MAMFHVLLSLATFAIALAALGLLVYLIGKAKWIIGQIERLNRRNDHQFRHLFRHIQIQGALHEQLKLPHPLPPTGGKAGSPDFLKALADHVLAAKPQRLVECGSGLSTVVAARCLQLNGMGHIFSLEHMPAFAMVTRDELARQGLSDWATVLDAPLTCQQLAGVEYQWYRADGLPSGEADLVIVDGPPARTGASPRYPAGPKLFPRLSSGGAIFIDDAQRPEERGVIERWRQEFKNIDFKVDTDGFQKGFCIARPIAGGPAADHQGGGSSR